MEKAKAAPAFAPTVWAPVRTVPNTSPIPKSPPPPVIRGLGGRLGGAAFSLNLLWAGKGAYDAIRAVPSQLPWMPGKPVDPAIWFDPQRVTQEASHRFGHVETPRLNLLRLVRQKQSMPRDRMGDPFDRSMMVQNENGEWVQVPLDGQETGALKLRELWEHGLPGKPMHERAADELMLIEVELGRRNFQIEETKTDADNSLFKRYAEYIRDLAEALRKRANGENVPLPIWVMDTPKETKMGPQSKPGIVNSAQTPADVNNQGAAATSNDKSGPKPAADANPTPYEARYRAVYAAGGTKFYPGTPSRNLEKYLDQRSDGPGAAVIAGCGEGRNVSPLLKRGWSVTGIDSADSALKVAARDYVGKDQVKWVLASVLDEAVVPKDSVDLVVSVEFLHLLTSRYDRMKFYGNVYRMLRPGGVAFFENNGRLHASESVLLDGGKVEPRTIQTANGPIQVPLVRLPTVMLNGKDLRQELEGAGFVVDSMQSDSFQHPDTLREQIIVIARKP